MTLNDLECPIHLKVRLVDGTLDIRLLRVSDSTIRIGVARARRGRRGSGLEGLVPPPCGQLTRCFCAVAELLVLYLKSLVIIIFFFFFLFGRGSVVSNPIGMKFGTIILRVYTHRRHTFNMAAMTCFHVEKCCQLMNARAALALIFHFSSLSLIFFPLLSFSRVRVLHSEITAKAQYTMSAIFNKLLPFP